MVLVDTSVWIRFLADRQPYAIGMVALLSRDEVVGHELVCDATDRNIGAESSTDSGTGH